MNIIFSHMHPFSLAHGGTETLIVALKDEMARLGVLVEFERWWDADQKGSVLHYFGRPIELNVSLARAKGYKVVMTELLDSTAARPGWKLWAQRQVVRIGSRVLGESVGRLGWGIYPRLDAAVYVTTRESQVAQYLFGLPRERCHVIPHGLCESAIRGLQQPAAPGDWLVSTGTIHPRKNTVQLALAALEAGVPIHFLGKPYSEEDPYFREFCKLVDQCIVRYSGFVSEEEKIRLLRGAKGFVLLSQYESGCISVYEAAAAGLPLLLPRYPWATGSYSGIDGITLVDACSPGRIAAALRRFYAVAVRRTSPVFPVFPWREIAQRYLDIYRDLLPRA